MKKFLLIFACISISILAFSQKKKHKLNEKESQDLLGQIFNSNSFLDNSGREACGCIDSVSKAETDQSKKLEAISKCIEDQVNAYQLSTKLLATMTGKEKNNSISLSVDKQSQEYKQYYYEIERWLKDSCKELNKVLMTHDEENENSMSKDKDAMDAYNSGLRPLANENYTEAIPFFEKAVSIDPKFAFAWDNLGICFRKTGKYEKAEAAYKQSLAADPKGKTALQNLPVVYLLQKKNDEAIEAYNSILKYYPGDPEVYYGIGLVYLQGKSDMENSLANICKAYSIYIEQKSPYRSDAEKLINMIYTQMKKDGKEESFSRILKENNITMNLK